MSKLLLDSQPLIILPELAAKIGLNESIVLQQIHYWLEINRKAKINFIDDHTWTFNSVSKWIEQFPFWSDRTLKRILKNLKEKDLIITANYNKKAYDRTLWYTVNYDKVDEIEKAPQSIENGHSDNLSPRQCQDVTMEKDNMSQPIPKTTKKITKKTTVREGVKSEDINTMSANSIPFYDYIGKLIKSYIDIETGYKQEIYNSIIYYCSKYEEVFRVEHIRYKTTTLKTIIKKIYDLYSVGIIDEQRDIVAGDDLSFEDFKTMADKNFIVRFNGKGDKRMSYTLLSFLNDNILINRFYEELL